MKLRRLVMASLLMAYIAAANMGYSNENHENEPLKGNLLHSINEMSEDRQTRVKSKDKIELIGVASLPGIACDKSGLTKPLDEGTVNNMLGGFSAVAYTGNSEEYIYVSDRGPKDGAVDWTCRFHRIRLSVNVNRSPSVELKLIETVLLRDKQGLPFTGLAAAYESTAKSAARLDPEGIRVSTSGNVFISDEYGPRLIEFSKDGEMIREFEIPPKLLIENPGLSKSDENPKNVSGRSTNRGMEGLSILNERQVLLGLMQSPLLQDSSREIPGKPCGLNCRLVEFSMEGKSKKEMCYHLDSTSNRLNEILACGSNSFIVIERDGEIGELAQFKKLMLISTEGATNVASVEKLPPMNMPKGVKNIKKTVLIDLLDPQWGLLGKDMPEKIEGLAFGPDLPDGRRLLVVTTDNDFEPTNPSFTYVFAVPPALLNW